MPFRHHRAEADQVAAAQQALRLDDAGALRHDVSGASTEHGIGQLAQVAERAPPQRTAEDPRGPFALGAPRGVGGDGEDPRDLAVHDDEGRVRRYRDVPALERLEVDVQRVALTGAHDGQGVEEADVRARRALRLLAVAGERQRSSSAGSWGPRPSTARRKATENAALEESPAPTGRVLVTVIEPPQGGGCSRRRPAARRASGGTGAVVAPAGARSESSGISTCLPGISSESRPIRKVPVCGLNETSVAMPTAMGSDSPPL